MPRLPAILLLFPFAAIAAEVDCPLAYPSDPLERLEGGEPLVMDGTPVGGPSDEFDNRGERWHSRQYYGFYQERKAELLCEYGQGHEIRVPIPGLLVRCDWLGRDVLKPKPVEPGTGGPTETIFLRVWCTSRP